MTESNFAIRWNAPFAFILLLCNAPMGEVRAQTLDATPIVSSAHAHPADPESGDDEALNLPVPPPKRAQATVDVAANGVHVQSADGRFALRLTPFVQSYPTSKTRLQAASS